MSQRLSEEVGQVHCCRQITKLSLKNTNTYEPKNQS
jgi:hypothetical protein